VEETIAFDGTPVVITDTAGIHASVDPVESLGIEKSEAAVAAADLVLFMVDGSVPVQSADRRVFRSITGQGAPRHPEQDRSVPAGARA
jgi:tRNA modification GTPase